MRYFARMAYLGTRYFGWQRQPGQISVQEVVETNLSLVLRHPVEVVGCGRTDTGVHASAYFLHFDTREPLPEIFARRINQVLPGDIALLGLQEVHPDAHARYDATRRSYHYYLSFRKDPFRQLTTCYFPYPDKPDLERMRQAAGLLLDYEDFFPFCRSKSDAKTMRCDLVEARWDADGPERLRLTLSANRFLRGMVRLIVGMCLNVGQGKMSLEDVKMSLDRQERLPMPYSAPAEGLFLADIRYPYDVP